jgi:hypothetical protein
MLAAFHSNVVLIFFWILDKGHSTGGAPLSLEGSMDSDKGVTKKEVGSITFSSKFDLHSDSKSDKEADRKSINSLGERQLTDENLGVPSKVSHGNAMQGKASVSVCLIYMNTMFSQIEHLPPPFSISWKLVIRAAFLLSVMRLYPVL